MRAKGKLLLASALAMMLPGVAHASGTIEGAPPTRPGMIEWVLPSAAELRPLTDAEKAEGQASGRPLPQPELLQPELDPGLQPYVPTPGLKIERKFMVGSSDVLPGLVQAWADAFRKHHPGFSLEIDKPMAGSLGALELIKGNLDFVFVSRELKPSDLSGFREKFGYDPLSLPIAGGTWRHFGFLDSLAIMVHPDNPLQQLSFSQLDAILSATRHRGGRPIRTWGDLGLTGEWAKRPVMVYGIKPWNGFEEFVRQRVMSTSGKRGEWRTDQVHYDPTFFAVARRVAADKGAIGYTGLSALDSAVKIIPLSESDTGPFLAPTYENVASAEYPLSRLVFLNTNAKPDKDMDPALREFLRFILSRDGQAVIRQQGIFLPLRAHQVASSLKTMGER